MSTLSDIETAIVARLDVILTGVATNKRLGSVVSDVNILEGGTLVLVAVADESIHDKPSIPGPVRGTGQGTLDDLTVLLSIVAPDLQGASMRRDDVYQVIDLLYSGLVGHHATGTAQALWIEGFDLAIGELPGGQLTEVATVRVRTKIRR